MKPSSKFLIFSTIFSSIVFALLFVVSAHAQYLGFDVGDDTGLSNNDVRYTAVEIIRVILQLLGTIAIVINIYAGFIWMTAGGNDEKVGEAKKWLTRGVIGLVIILAAYAITIFVMNSLVDANASSEGSFKWNLFSKYTQGKCSFKDSKTQADKTSNTMTKAACSEIGGTWKAESSN